MKIRMITFHTPKNYGAVLQAFSLMSHLKNYSDDVKVIDFNTPHLRSIYPLTQKPRSAKQLVKFVMELRHYGKKKRKFKKFEDYVKTKLDLTERYESFEALSSDPPKADHYFTGSDQVFNPNRIPEERKAFYLSFGADDVKRVSYAGSFGVATIPDDKKQEVLSYLQRFDSISVREESGVEIVKGTVGREAAEVLDPVFLNDGEFWRKQAKPYKLDIDKYLFYYRLMSSPESDAAARRIAEEKGLKLVVMTDGLLKWKADRVLRDVGPDEFLYLMDNAEFVATDSFHGVAFSLILQKQFAFTDCNPKLAERALNLLKKAGASKAAIINGRPDGFVIDYDAVGAALTTVIDASKRFIEKSL